MKRVLIVLLLLAVAMAARAYDPPTRAEVDEARAQGRYLATITMENGKQIEIVLEGKEMPLTVANFVKLIKAKFYDGLQFNYVEESEKTDRTPEARFIQAGFPLVDGSGTAGYTIPLEISPYLHHFSGAVTMLRKRAPNTASCQFLIMDKPLEVIDGQYAVFGWVKSGMDVVKTAKAGDVMKTVTVAPYDGKEECPLYVDVKPSVPYARELPTRAEVDAVKQQGRYLATITLDNDKQIKVVLEGKEAPIHVANFVKLANAKFYDGLTFHRVETKDKFKLIQGGDPKGDGSGGPGYSIKFEEPVFVHKKGAFGMARSNDPNSAGCQFYITLCDIPDLDNNYVVFGWVKSGLDNAEKVKIGDKIKTITVAPYDGKEKAPIVKDDKPTENKTENK